MWVRPLRVEHIGKRDKGLELRFEKLQHLITWYRSMSLQVVATEKAEKKQKQKVWGQGSQEKSMFMKEASVSGVK